MIMRIKESTINDQPPERDSGLNLAEQRRRQGISLEALAEATKISRHFLHAIEMEEFQKLPGGVYNTNYIRQYAAFTGIDEASILSRYVDFVRTVDPIIVPEVGISRLQHAWLHILSFFRNSRVEIKQKKTSAF